MRTSDSENIFSTGKNKRSLLEIAQWAPDDIRIFLAFADGRLELMEPESRRRKPLVLPSWSKVHRKRPEDSLARIHFSWSPVPNEAALAYGNRILVLEIVSGGDLEKNEIAIAGKESRLNRMMESIESNPLLARLQRSCSRESLRKQLEQYLAIQDISAIQSLRWSLSGDSIFVGTSSCIQILATSSGELIARLEPEPFPGLLAGSSVSPDGKYAAAFFFPAVDLFRDIYWNFSNALPLARPLLLIWDTENGVLLERFSHSSFPSIIQTNICWRPDSRRLAWVSDNRIYLLDLSSMIVSEAMRTQEKSISHIDWSFDGKRLAVHDTAEGVIVFDAGQDSRQVSRQCSYRDSLWKNYQDLDERYFSWSSRGSRIAVGDIGYGVDIWNVV